MPVTHMQDPAPGLVEPHCDFCHEDPCMVCCHLGMTPVLVLEHGCSKVALLSLDSGQEIGLECLVEALG